MKGSLAVIGTFRGRGAAALVVDGALDDLLIDAPDDRIRPGAILRARAGRAMKGQGGMILDTPQGPAFLRHASGVAQGSSLIVQAVSYAEPGKATPVTDRLVFKSRYCLVTPGAPGLNISRDIRDEERRVGLRALIDGMGGEDGPGIVLRTAAAGAADEAVEDDVAAMLEAARAVLAEPVSGAPELLLDGPEAADLAWREWPEPDRTETGNTAFARLGVDDMIDGVLDPCVPLGGGAFMFIEPTRALVAVDVNTGGDTSPAAGLKANIAALRALPRALRLRGLGGQIVADLAPMPKKDRRAAEQALRTALKRDPIETALVGWTPLGHLEIQRKRERLPLAEALA